MDYKVSVSPIATANIREAVAYYKENTTLKVAQNFVIAYQVNVCKLPLFRTPLNSTNN